MRFDEVAFLQERHKQGAAQEGVSARQRPASSLQPSSGMHEILNQAAINRLMRREELGVVLKELARFNGTYQARRFQGVRNPAEVGDKAREIGCKEVIAWRISLGLFDGAVNLYAVRSEKEQKRDQALIPHVTMALSLLLCREPGARTKIDGRSTIHAQNTA